MRLSLLVSYSFNPDGCVIGVSVTVVVVVVFVVVLALVLVLVWGCC